MIDKKFLNQIIILVLLGALFLLGWFIIKPVLVSIFLGILTAYIFYSSHRWLSSKVKNETLSAVIVTFLISLALLIMFLIALGSVLSQGLNIYNQFIALDFNNIVKTVLPNFLTQSQTLDTVIESVNSFIARTLAEALAVLPDLFLKLPQIVLHFFVFLFTLFFGLRDGKIALTYIESLSPLKKEVNARFLKNFKEVTRYVLLGEIIVGVVQGVVAGIGYFIFGVPNPVILTFVTMIVSVIPIVGPWLVWIPVDIYLFGIGNTFAGFGLLIYGILIISWLDTIIRPIVVSRGIKVNSAIILIGMIGGIFAFGILGLIVGPLILTYILLVFELYLKKNNEINIVFQETD